MSKEDVYRATVERIILMDHQTIMSVLTDEMLWENEGPAWSCSEAEAIAAAAYRLGAPLETMAMLVVNGHGQPGRSEDEGDLHFHEEEAA